MSERRDAWIEIDHAALRNNVAHLRAHLAEGVAMCGVVKANAYGHGAPGVARTLIDCGVEHLAVITIDEGLELRAAGIDAPILLLHEPTHTRVDEVLAADLTATVFTAGTVAALDAAAARAGRAARIHLKVDTGLNRLGVPWHGIEALVTEHLRAATHLEVVGTFTHLAFADEPKHAVVDEQLTRFQDALDVLAGLGIDPGIRHVGNSAATLARPDVHADMVRPGVALYGLSPGPQVPDIEALQPVLSLRARVAQVKRLEPGEGVSYAHRWTAPRPTIVATIPLGYADGWPRLLTNNAEVLIGGVVHPAIGAVTMDSFVVDCGDMDVAVGDEAVLIGTQGAATLTADALAGRLGTINYEVVTRLAARLPREHRNR